MVKIVAAVLALVLAVLATGVRAEEAEDPLSKAMARNPDRFEAMLLDLVAGFGGPDGLTRDGIRDHIALKRAAARASSMRRLLALDLDGDGTILLAELQVAQRAASAAARGRMERQVAAADADGDGRITAAEMAADGKAAALGALDDEEERMLLSVLTLDADGNGALSTSEVRAAMARQDDGT